MVSKQTKHRLENNNLFVYNLDLVDKMATRQASKENGMKYVKHVIFPMSEYKCNVVFVVFA